MDGIDRIPKERVERIRDERMKTSIGSSSSEAESREALAESDLSKRGKDSIRRQERFGEDYSSNSEGVVRNSNHFTNFDGEDTSNIKTSMEASRLRPARDHSGVKNEGPVYYHGPARAAVSRDSFDNFLHHGEGPSSYAYYHPGGRTSNPGHYFDGLARVENLENDQGELVRKIDELKYQINQIGRSIDVTEKPKEIIDPYAMQCAAYFEGVLARPQGVNKQGFAGDGMGAPYFSQTPGSVPHRGRYDSRLRDSYPERGYAHESLQFEMPQRPPHQPQSRHTHWPYHEHFPGYYGDANHDLFVLHPRESFYHQLTCSCAQCCNKNWNLPPGVDPAGLYNRRFQIEPSNARYRPHLSSLRHGQQDYRSGVSDSPSWHPQKSPNANSISIGSKNDGSNHQSSGEVVAADKTARVWQPIAGGAPFIACSKCFELLKLPREHIKLAKDKHKMKCGACSSILMFEFGSKGSIASVSAHVEQVPRVIVDDSSGTMDGNVSY